MSEVNCSREDELLDALARGFVGSELDSHVRDCASCGELRVVAGALLDERTAAVEEVALPAAGSVWWRMRLRHRNEAEAAARRSLVVGQAITLTIAVTLGVVLFGAQLATGVRHAISLIRVSTPFLQMLAASAFIAIGVVGAGWVAVRK